MSQAAYESMNPATRDTCDALSHETGSSLAYTSCVRFAKTFSADYQSVSFKIDALMDPIEYPEDAMEQYVELCESTVRNQISEMNNLYDSLESMGVDDVNIQNYYTTAIAGYVEAMDVNVTKVCPWSEEESACEGKVCADNGFWPLFTEKEVEQLRLSYNSHFESCAATQCTYIEDEDAIDVGMKTMALSSPIFSAVMTAAVILYTCVDNHWEDREHELIDIGAHHAPHNPIGNARKGDDGL